MTTLWNYSAGWGLYEAKDVLLRNKGRNVYFRCQGLTPYSTVSAFINDVDVTNFTMDTDVIQVKFSFDANTPSFIQTWKTDFRHERSIPFYIIEPALYENRFRNWNQAIIAQGRIAYVEIVSNAKRNEIKLIDLEDPSSYTLSEEAEVGNYSKYVLTKQLQEPPVGDGSVLNFGASYDRTLKRYIRSITTVNKVSLRNLSSIYLYLNNPSAAGNRWGDPPESGEATLFLEYSFDKVNWFSFTTFAGGAVTNNWRYLHLSTDRISNVWFNYFNRVNQLPLVNDNPRGGTVYHPFFASDDVFLRIRQISNRNINTKDTRKTLDQLAITTLYGTGVLREEDFGVANVHLWVEGSGLDTLYNTRDTERVKTQNVTFLIANIGGGNRWYGGYRYYWHGGTGANANNEIIAFYPKFSPVVNATSNTITFSGKVTNSELANSESHHYILNKKIHIVSGEGAGQNADVIAYNVVTKTATIANVAGDPQQTEWQLIPGAYANTRIRADMKSIVRFGEIEADNTGMADGVIMLPSIVQKNIVEPLYGWRYWRYWGYYWHYYYHYRHYRTRNIISFKGRETNVRSQIVQTPPEENEVPVVVTTPATPEVPEQTVSPTVTEKPAIVSTDPFAQTFFVDEKVYPQGLSIASIKLLFESKDPEYPVQIQIRPVIAGIPQTGTMIKNGVTYLRPENIRLVSKETLSVVYSTDDNPFNDVDYYSEANFPEPVVLEAGREYAIIISSASSKHKLYTSKVGEKLLGTERVLSSNPYLGVLYKFQNSSKWEPFANEDLCFELTKATYSTTTPASVELNLKALPINLNGETDITNLGLAGLTSLEGTAPPPSDGTINVHSIFISSSDKVPSNTRIDYSYKTTRPNGEDFFKPIELEETIELDDNLGSRLVNSNNRSFVLKAQMYTNNPNIAPSIDVSKLNVVLIENIIDDNAVANSDIIITNRGQDYSNAQNVVVTISGGGGSGATARANLLFTLFSNTVTDFIVVNSGDSATDVPVATITGANTQQATATVNVKAVNVFVTNEGEGYSIGDTFTVVGGTGTAATLTVSSVDFDGAVADVIISNGGRYSVVPPLSNSVASFIVLDSGDSATDIPNIVITGANTSQATATVNVKLTGITITTGGTGYANNEILDVTGGTGTTANIRINTVNSETGEILTVSVNNAGRYSSVPTVENNLFTSNNSANGTGFSANITFGIESVTVNVAGSGYDRNNVFTQISGSNIANAVVDVALGELTLNTSSPGKDFSAYVEYGVESLTVNNRGQGYTSDNTFVTVSGSNIANTNVLALLTGTSGYIDRLIVTNGGSGYTGSPNVTISGDTTSTINARAVIIGEDQPNGGIASAKYITRKITLANGFNGGDLRVLFSAYKPEECTIDVYYKVLSEDDADNFDNKRWTLMTLIGGINVHSSDRNDVKKYVYAPGKNNVADNFITYDGFPSFKYFSIKVVMRTKNPGRVPKISFFRAVALSALLPE